MLTSHISTFVGCALALSRQGCALGDCVLRWSRREVRAPHPLRWPSAFDLQLAWRRNIAQRCCGAQQFKARQLLQLGDQKASATWSGASFHGNEPLTERTEAFQSQVVVGLPGDPDWKSPDIQRKLSISTEVLLISSWVNTWENIVGSVQNPYVISRCGIFNGQSRDLPHHPAYQVNHTYSLSHFPSFSFSLPLSCMHIFMQLHSLVSHLCRTQTSSTYVAGDNCPAGLLLRGWNRLSCLSLRLSFCQSVSSVHLCCASLLLSSLLVISISS